MTEVVPRRRRSRLELLAQTGVAVVAGMAAMYVLQNYQASRELMPAVAPVEPPPPPAETGPVLEALESVKPRPKPANSMLIKPEKGGAPMAMVSVFGEQAPERESARLRGKAVKLEPRPMGSEYSAVGRGTEGIGRGFNKVEFAPLAEPKPVSVAGVRTVKTLETVRKGERPAEDFVSSPLKPEEWGLSPFWTKDRQVRVGAAAAVAVVGFGYLLAASGALAAKKPERAEGEL